MWVARNPPGFAFVEFEDPRDAEDAVRGLDGRYVSKFHSNTFCYRLRHKGCGLLNYLVKMSRVSHNSIIVKQQWLVGMHVTSCEVLAYCKSFDGFAPLCLIMLKTKTKKTL